MPQVHEINDLEELAGFRWQWNTLAAKTAGATFFQTYDWFAAYWKNFGDDARMRVLLVREGDQTTGIVPLVVRTRRNRLGAVRVLSYPLDNWGSFYGPVGQRVSSTLVAALGYLRRARRDWDMIELASVDAHGTDEARTVGAMTQEGFSPLVEPWQTSALINLAELGDWESYWASRTSHWRTNVRRDEKRLSARGEVGYLRYRPAGITAQDGDPRWDLYDECERIAGESWQGESQTGTTLSHDAIRPFLRDCHYAAARAGALDLNLLLVDGHAVAFNYAYHFAGSIYGLRTGYLAEVAREGAGTVLQRRMIESSFGLGDHTYDLGPDYLACKRNWLTETRESYRYTHFAAEPVAQLARVKRSFGRLWAAACGATSAPAESN